MLVSPETETAACRRASAALREEEQRQAFVAFGVARGFVSARGSFVDEGAIRTDYEVDVERSGLPADEYVAVPVQRGPDVVGHFLLTATSHLAYPTREQRRVAVLLADQVAAAQ